MFIKNKAITLSLIGSLVLANMASAAVTWKLSHNQGRDYPAHKAMEHFAQKTKEYTNGEVIIRIYPDATLGGERESLELLSGGAIQMVKVSAASLEDYSPSFGMITLPYIYSSRDAYYKAMEGEVGARVLNSSTAKGLIGLTFYEEGARSFYANKPILKPEDLVGMKIRVMQSRTAVKMVEALGGIPTPMPQGELYTALQQKVVDGGENNPPVYSDMRHFEVSKVYSLDEHARYPSVLLVSTQAYDALTNEQKEGVKKAAEDSMKLLKDKLWPEAEKNALDRAIAGGAQVLEVEKAPFKAKVQDIYAEFKTENPEWSSDLDIILEY